MNNPEFIDNLDGNTLAAAIERVLRSGILERDSSLGEAPLPPGRLDIASAFFSPAGFGEVAAALNGIEKVRLMIGAEPLSEAMPPRRPLEETPVQFERRLLRERLAELESGLRRERDRFPFTRSGRSSLRSLIAILKSGKMETRRYERAFMHAKAYIFAPRIEAYGGGAGVIAGSSNLTKSGVTTNLELNLGRFDDPIVGQAKAWYERLWDEAVPFDLTELFEEVFAEWSPFDIFLRTLFQLYGSEIAEDERSDKGLPLTNFQKHGAARALRLIRENGGAIVADEVGLGKTFIAGEILKLYVGNRHRCLLICPAQLRDTTWKKFRSTHFLGDVECLSYEELAIDRQLGMANPDQFKDKLARGLNEYQLVVVDEAHNYRNPDTPTRAGVLRRLLWGQRRDVLLLTATPVNNSLWDLYTLIQYYMRQDAFLADRGILSIKGRFDDAAKADPSALSPDVLYPIIDATTVKRTRQFVKKHYSGDLIKLPDGTEATIAFPEPKAITVRYHLSEPLAALFDLIDDALDPGGGDRAITFARYVPDAYALDGGDPNGDAPAATTIGLLRSGLLKRFESSAFAFSTTLEKMIREHRTFLAALDKGHVIRTELIREISAVDDDDLDELLSQSGQSIPAGQFNIVALRNAVEEDLQKIEQLSAAAVRVASTEDTKLVALAEALSQIAKEAADEAVSDDDARQKRKVLIFSFFADTVAYLREALGEAAKRDPALAPYLGRIIAVAGSTDVDKETDVGRQGAVFGFAPVSTEATGYDDRFDLLVTTDILAEGVNLQQCRHIINYDVPWNPMRLVQRHGRVDRIGSPHKRVFLRTIFPAERLDQLLSLEQRIMEKIAMAAASVGVISPVDGGAAGGQVFTETRAEIEKLLEEDPSLFERGSAGAGQTGEEYRQTLRKALQEGSGRIEHMPYGSGSGMAKGERTGLFFCASVGDRTYLRFVPTSDDWKPSELPMVREIGTCLRIIECEPTTPRSFSDDLEAAALDLWQLARNDIYDAWMRETDPVNLQPRVRPLNLRVAEFIRAHRPQEDDGGRINKALDILEAPWPRREEIMLRDWFNGADHSGSHKAALMVDRILDSGLQPFQQPKLLPPIEPSDIELVCWLGVAQRSLPDRRAGPVAAV